MIEINGVGTSWQFERILISALHRSDLNLMDKRVSPEILSLTKQRDSWEVQVTLYNLLTNTTDISLQTIRAISKSRPRDPRISGDWLNFWQVNAYLPPFLTLRSKSRVPVYSPQPAYVRMYIHAGVNPIVLSRGRRFERATPRYFQFRAVVSPWLGATKQLAIRLDGTFSTFNSHGELACRANTHGDWKGTGRGDGHTFPHPPPVSRGSAFRCVVTITVSGRAAARSSRGPGITVFPTVRKPFGYIDRAERFGSPEICTFLLFILVSRILPSRRHFLRGSNALAQPWVSV